MLSDNGNGTPVGTAELQGTGSSTLSYGGWSLTPDPELSETFVATSERGRGDTQLLLGRSQGVFCSGFWPAPPTRPPRLLLGGTCLYTRVWSIRFAARGSKAPRPLSMGLPGDLKRIVKLLEAGRPVVGVSIPTKTAQYHRLLLRWQLGITQQYPSVEEVRYSIPIGDYHGYILQVERAAGVALPGLHAAADDYVAVIKDELTSIWGGLASLITYDEQMTAEVTGREATSRENDMQLYLGAARESRVLGMEDLPEVALAVSLAKRRDVVIPCAVAVLSIPDAYMADDPTCAPRTATMESLT